ncbi:MAG: T9SS type A sorting domain-containing protein [Crocinitomicaceae bacterium]|nr:T9SS type A sorting domain-containing protein [Crocinitomicaceae bacterium]
MKICALVLALFAFMSYGHRGEILAIEKPVIVESADEVIYQFRVENINSTNLSGVQIEFWLNGQSIDSIQIPFVGSNQKWLDYEFSFERGLFNPSKDLIQIEITQIFGKKHDWGGWDSNRMDRQTNTLYSEFYADAPWRMKRTDDQGAENDLPIHFFLHDADLVTGFTMKIDYIDIKIKNASSSSFGAPLLFDTIPSTVFQGMFSSVSPADSVLNMKQFDPAALTATAVHTMDFDAETDWLDDFVSVDATYWYFTFNIPGSILTTFENVIDIEATISYANTLIPDDDVIRMRVYRSDEDIPTQPDYYRGDTHLHSMFTQNDAEIGLPLSSTKEASKLIGLDWITTTDHTSDFDNYGTGIITDNWDIIRDQANFLNGQDSSLIYIAGQEVAVNNSKAELVHMLVYPSYMDPYSLPFMGDGNGDLSATTVDIDDVVNEMALVDGFSYCAHPFATEDKLPNIPVNGGVWNLGHSGFEPNGNTYPFTGGSIICNDLSADSDILSASPNELVKEGIKGSQIWNLRATLAVSGLSGNQLDPFDVTNTASSMVQIDTTSFGFHLKRFRQGQEVVNYVNQLGLALKNTQPGIINWKLYYSAGSDAHGSFNSSNTDDFGGTGDIHNNAVGKLNTLTYCPNGMGSNGEEVLKSLYNGNTTLSDGPILTIGISTDGNNLSNELIMGQDEVLYTNPNDVFINFHYTTTPEFGDITTLSFIVGTSAGEYKINLPLSFTNGDHVQSYNLLQLTDSVLGSTPTGEYLYVRAELQTFVDYSTMTGIYRTDFDYFHSFTNPIWINWNEHATTPESDNSFSIYPNPTSQSIVIELINFENVETLQVFDNSGRLIYVTAVNQPKIQIDLADFAAGIYLVKVNHTDGTFASQKVIKQ